MLATIIANVVLIESDWNLKMVGASSLASQLSSINRIRLEFKDLYKLQGAAAMLGY